MTGDVEYGAPVLQKRWKVVVFGVWPVVIALLNIGQFTGHYRGLYAQTEAALTLQIVMIVLMMASVLYAAAGGEPFHEA